MRHYWNAAYDIRYFTRGERIRNSNTISLQTEFTSNMCVIDTAIIIDYWNAEPTRFRLTITSPRTAIDVGE